MKIKYCIFDVGQVCYPFSLEPLNDFCHHYTTDKSLIFHVKTFDYNPFMLGKQTFIQFCQTLCKTFKIPYSSALAPMIDTALHSGVGDFYPETLNLMEYLKQHNIEICLLSNALPNLADTADTLTDKIFTSYNLGLLKPDPAIYKTVLENLAVSPSEVIFIDDKARNVSSATALGIKAIIFNRNTIYKDVLTCIKK